MEVPGSETGAGDRNRTYDLRITNAPLYQLSYSGGSLGETQNGAAFYEMPLGTGNAGPSDWVAGG